MGILSKHTIQTWILPHLSVGKRGFESKVPLDEVVEAIVYRLKTGCQWRELPVKQFFSTRLLTWQGVFYYFNKWTKQGCWQRMWIELLKANHRHLDLSCIQLDGSHTPAKNGGQAIGYQARKAGNTTNSLFLSDNQGIMVAISTPQEGNHHDLFEIQTLFDELCQVLTAAGINLRGLFLNADPGFDSHDFRQKCGNYEIEANIKPNVRNTKKDTQQEYYFDELLYKRRTVIEHANAWLDSFKTLLVRFECKAANWVAFHLIAFAVLFLRKINKK